MQRQRQFDVAMAVPDHAQRHRFPDNLIHILGDLAAFAFLHEIAQITDDCAGAQGLGHRLFHRFSRALQLARLRILALQQPLGRIGIIGHRRQRLVQFMGDRGAHLAHGAEPSDMRQLILHRQDALPGPFSFRHIARGLGRTDHGARCIQDRRHRQRNQHIVPILVTAHGLVMLHVAARPQLHNDLVFFRPAVRRQDQGNMPSDRL